jgi:hypothetical protein
MIDLKHIPTRSELKYFGLIFAAFFGLIGGVIGWRFDGWAVSRVLWILGGAVGIVYYALPMSRTPIFRGWVHLTFPLAWFMSHLIMGLAYYLVLTPIGMIMRMLGHDPMSRKLDRQATTYWIKRGNQSDAGRYFKQY